MLFQFDLHEDVNKMNEEEFYLNFKDFQLNEPSIKLTYLEQTQ